MGPRDQLEVVQEAKRLGLRSVWPPRPVRTRDVVRERLAAYRDAGVSMLMVTPMAFNRQERIDQLRAVAELAA